MKKIFVLFGFMFVVLLTSGFSVGATVATTNEEVIETTDELPDAGLTPGDTFYGVDKFFENIALKLTFSDEKRAEKLAKVAEERLAELNELDPEKAAIYADELFNEYGLSLEKANLYVQKLAAEGKISEEKLAKLEAKVAKAEERQDKVNEKAKEKISDEVKESVNEAIKNAKMSIFTRFTDKEAMNTLHDEGYGYGELLKLQAIAELSSKTIDELLLVENVVTTDEENEKAINFDVLLETLELTRDDLKTKLTEYKGLLKETMKTKMDEAQKQADERREEVKEKINEKKEK
ncbi:MAG: hypothetical protein K0Q49_906 [Haloplasmataceae bacterium]|jgi:hypothetical protein|nr:hypothetical protein [Haloplasmataceae bacterium]